MDLQIEERNGVERHITITLPKEDLSKEEERGFAALRKKAQVKGFRAGKVPRDVLNNLYGKRVRAEAVDTLVVQRLRKLNQELPGLIFISPPNIQDEGKKNSDVVVSFHAEVKPQLEVQDYLGVELESSAPKLDEQMIDQELEALREKHRSLEPVEDRRVAELGDFVIFDFRGIGGGALEEFRNEGQLIEVREGIVPTGLENGLIGATIDEAREVEVTAPEPYPHFPHLAGQSFKLEVTVRQIKSKLLPELDDEFARDTGIAETLADLRESLRNRLAERLRSQHEEQLRELLLQRLRDAHPFDLPHGWLQQRTQEQIENTARFWAQSGLPQETIQELVQGSVPSVYAEVTRTFQNQIIIDAIAEREGIEANPTDQEQYLRNLAAQHNTSIDKIRRIYRAPHMQEQLGAETKREATLKFLIANAKLVEPKAPESSEDAQDAPSEGE
ncbi:MAG: trigger factor [Myxococcota bacterium]|jgi:trigger factor|nr:trigger factor [Myxococcota bacterium]